MGDSLPRFIALRPRHISGAYIRYVPEKGPFYRRLQNSSPEVASERYFTRFEVVRASGIGRDLVHIRSTYNNKYLVLESERSSALVAGADEPGEDMSKWSCTMFRVSYNTDNRSLSLLYQSGGSQHSLLLNTDNCLHIVKNFVNNFLFEVTNMGTLALLPKYVAFKGDNNMYLSSRHIRTRNRLQFRSEDLLDSSVHHESFTLSNGNVCLRSNHFGQFWRKSNPEWIWCDTADITANDSNNVFRPQRLDSQGNSIALLNLGNNKYCMRRIRGGQPRLIDTLTASAGSVVSQAVLQVEEAIRDRQIYDIRYNIDDSRIYNVAPVTVGTLVRITYNWTNLPTLKQLRFTHLNVTQEYFNSSHSWKVAYSSRLNITVIPKLVKGTVELDASYEGSVEWSKKNEETEMKTTTLYVPVPAMTRSEVTLLVQRGSIDVPFSYTQRDILPNGREVISYLNDGIYSGLNTEVITHFIKSESLSDMSASELEEARKESEAEEAKMESEAEEAAAALPSKL